jgi:predicted Fe-S protein YdhL (DUF1289 family)
VSFFIGRILYMTAMLPRTRHRQNAAAAAALAINWCCDEPPAFARRIMVKCGASQSGLQRMTDIPRPVQSPCVRNCCLDDDLTCLGCFRSIEEIKEWGMVDDQRRLIILQNAWRRKDAYRRGV